MYSVESNRRFLRFLFDPEDGGDMFLQNVGYFQLSTPLCIPEDITLHNHRCEKIKFYSFYTLSEDWNTNANFYNIKFYWHERLRIVILKSSLRI
jgi:hypothetical protein